MILCNNAVLGTPIVDPDQGVIRIVEIGIPKAFVKPFDENSEVVEKFLEYDPDYILENVKEFDTFKISDGMFAVNPGTHHYEGSFAARIKRVR